MYSDASEFDREDEDTVSWSSTRTIDNNRSNTSTLRPVSEFGNLVDTHGWIQCPSKSYPNRVYFHNVHSNCNTWYRPISRYIDIPFSSIKKVYNTDDVSANNIDLLSVSDSENEPSVSAAKRDGDKSLTTVPDVIARYYYTPQVDLTSDTDSCNLSVDAFECHYEEEQIDENNNIDEGIKDEKSESESGCSTLYATNFLETEFFVEENEINTEKLDQIFNSSNSDISSAITQTSSGAPCFVYTVPRLKRISFEDLELIKPRKIRVSNRVQKEPKRPRKIICDMYGVRTINYDLPAPDQVRTEVGVKSTSLSESDSDDICFRDILHHLYQNCYISRFLSL
ncbi:uncharacterized protein [Anoplolepis gracilipes]|uniref:uncharacterized protein isoform X1 n=1 Tax=Anoplolepis gracilipes TaxID=354296 RepID=UPI003BA07579